MRRNMSKLLRQGICRFTCASLLAWGALIASAYPASGVEAAAPLGEAKKDADGFLSHAVADKDRDAMTQIMVLLPDKLEESRRYPVLYILQGSSDSGEFFGHHLREIKKHDLHNKLGLVCVMDAPGFLQYLADDAKVKAVRKETRLILIGYDVYRDHIQHVHEKLARLEVPHVYEDGPPRKHRWDSGWMEQAMRLLVSSKLDRKSNE